MNARLAQARKTARAQYRGTQKSPLVAQIARHHAHIMHDAVMHDNITDSYLHMHNPFLLILNAPPITKHGK